MSNDKIQAYIKKQSKWSHELQQLRSILVTCDVQETMKWGIPTYTAYGKNIVGLGAFKEHFSLWFFQGALINDPNGRLVNAQTGKTKAMRHMRFNNSAQIDISEIRDFVARAVQNAKDGKEIKADRNKEIEIPDELANTFSEVPEIKVAFENLSKSKRRELAEYISSAKRIDTRQRRLAKAIVLIKEGKGLNDAYRK